MSVTASSVDVAVAPGIGLRVLRWSPSEPAAWPSFVLVHGLASNARLWDGVAERLAAAGHDVAAVDLRGHGRSSKPDGGYDLATVVDDLAALLRTGWWGRPFVAGQSWGGNVVLELAWRHRDLVAGVACVDGGTIDLQRRFATWDECALTLAPPTIEGTPVTVLEGWIRDAHPDWPESGIQGALACFEVRRDGTVAPWLTFERHLQVLHGLWGHRPQERVAEVQVPVLLLPADTGDPASTDDKRRSVEAAASALPRGRVHWFSPADHDVHAQYPAEVAEVLRAAATDPAFVGR
ncbi:MAG: alpha/beta hydrolase [Acidimicrobiales bacterium]|nr:alpha/beta hydrolase [Acidimicrobiales bacterium]